MTASVDLEKEYRGRFGILTQLSQAIEGQLRDYLKKEPRIDRISARPKSVESFVKKAQAQLDAKPKYEDPLRQIQDQVGARVVTFYLSDIERLANIVNKYYRPIESKAIVPDHEWKFGYFGRHFVLLIPSDVVSPDWDKDALPQFFELQLKTLFQHAWSEANHDLGYKPTISPHNSASERKLAFTSAQAWGADHIFDELFRERGE
jgi:ppGpp synthetase/RelA/SpoT-type nucleotidyltranferase